MRSICVVTGTRAEYGLLRNVMYKINESKKLKLQLVVTGTHLSQDFGYTLKEILKDGFTIDEKVPILMQGNSKDIIAKEMGLFMIGLSQCFQRLKPDLLLVLGDRYEIFAAAATAMVMNIPIAHISGGEITEGAVDEQIRHSITKMASIHFPGAYVYAQNIINMGEEKWRVFNVGDPGIEGMKKMKFLSKEELCKEIGILIDEETLLVTFHSVTLEYKKLEDHVNNLINALYKLNKKTVITYPNADEGGKYIIERLKEFQKSNNKVFLYESLGSLKYLSVMKYCGAVVGNSSSAIVEAPFLKVPVVDIGNRQKGRLKAENIIECGYEENEIINAIIKALSKEFRDLCANTKSLYGEGNTSEEIVKILEGIPLDEKLLKKKLTWSD